MRDVVLFAEDDGHEKFLGPLVRRLARSANVELTLRTLSSTGGHGQVFKKLKAYIKDLHDFAARLPDLVIVATDSNCHGFRERRGHLYGAAESIRDRILWAVPDPHIERWLLLDPEAFERVVGARCAVPVRKCDRDQYKKLLREAVAAAGVMPLLGGLEYAEDLAEQIDHSRAKDRDESFADFVDELNAWLRR